MVPQNRYHINWHRYQLERLALVGRASNGDTAAWAELKRRVYLAGVWAAMSVNRKLWQHEDAFVRWHAGDLTALAGLPGHVNAPRDMRAFVDNVLTLDMLRDLSGHTLVDALMTVCGLGTAKATFAAACLSYDDCPCLDTNMNQIFGLKPANSIKLYRERVKQTTFVHTLDQWDAFMVVESFPQSQHDCYYDIVFRNRWVTPPATRPCKKGTKGPKVNYVQGF